MSRYVLEIMQAAVYKLLHEAHPERKIFTSIPDLNEPPPYVVLLDLEQEEQDAYKGVQGYRVTYAIGVWDRSLSKANVHAMLEEIFTTLRNGTLDIAGEDLSVLDVKAGPTAVREVPGDAQSPAQYGLTQAIFILEDQG
jgi:hypothetical protein